MTSSCDNFIIYCTLTSKSSRHNTVPNFLSINPQKTFSRHLKSGIKTFPLKAWKFYFQFIRLHDVAWIPRCARVFNNCQQYFIATFFFISKVVNVIFIISELLFSRRKNKKSFDVEISILAACLMLRRGL